MKKYLQQLEGVATLKEKEIRLGNIFKKFWMTLEIHAYDYQNIGNVSTMEMHSMLNIMTRKSFFITSTKKDLPLIFYDRMKIFGKEILLLEIYDTEINKHDYPRLLEVSNRFKYLKEYIIEERWYSHLLKSESVHKTGKYPSKDLNVLETRWIEVLLDYIWDSEVCDETIKINKQNVYVDGLLSHGGTGTDFFVKMFGKETTEQLFKESIFGVQ